MTRSSVPHTNIAPTPGPVPRKAKSLRSATALLMAAALLTGCATAPPPAPTPDDLTEGPVLTLDQNAAILAAMNAVLATATASLDPADLAPRVMGPALAVRTSQLAVATIRQSSDLVTDLPGQYQQFILPTSAAWPRTIFAITQPTDPLETPRLIALAQDAPRDAYKLWGWVQLRPGTATTPFEMPSFADPTIGSELLAEGDTSLTMTPRDAVVQYARLISTDADAAEAGGFEPAADDPFRALLASVAESWRTALGADRVDGSYSFQSVPRPDTAIQVVRTADRGALVLAALDASETIQAVEGAVLPTTTQTQVALLQGQTVTNKLVGVYTDMIALYVPPAGSTDLVKLVGYSHVQTGASVG